MKKITLLLLTALAFNLQAQTKLIDFVNTTPQLNNPPELNAIVNEGKSLAATEVMSWYASDLYLQKLKDKANAGGYFSYKEGETLTCVFFSKAQNPKVLASVVFDAKNQKKGELDLTERVFTKLEEDLYQIRELTLKDMNADRAFFKNYEGLSPNLIPIINGTEKKVYVLTASKKTGELIIGNDYLFNFDKNNKITSKKSLHKNIIPLPYGEKTNQDANSFTGHNHSEETGEFITATDVCTLILYQKLTKWKRHFVISGKYVNFWDCERNELLLFSREAWDKMNKPN